jgi:hypothetical protein
MANNIKKVSDVNGSKMNLGQIELAAIRGVEQGFTQLKMLDVKTQSDAATESLSKADAGKLIVIPNVGQDSVYSLPAPEVGIHFHIVGFGALAADGHNDKIKLDIPQFFDIHFLGKSSTSWYVWGHSCSDTVISIGD